MTHNRMLDRVPSVAITHNHNELKVYQGNIVYLNDGDNFELRFFNPTNEKLGVEINFNGIRKGDGYLVINPGQDIILDRFLDEQRKMLFETYVINGNNEEAVKAIEKNGIITFNFFKEYGSYIPNDVKINYSFPPKPYKYNGNYGSGNIKFKKGFSGNSGTSGACGNSGTYGVSGTSGNGSIPSFPYSNNTTYTNNTFNTSFTCDANVVATASAGCGDFWFPSTATSASAIINPLETGRIEMGEISNQQLKAVNAQFCSTPIHTITYQLLPYSAMNRTINEIREYCTECGFRLRNNKWQFCPKCGEKIN